MPRLAVVVTLVLWITGCGKVGDPQPPPIRIPQPIEDLTASQTGYNLVLSWTNPTRNVDGSSAVDLAKVHISGDDGTAAVLDATGAGQSQSFSIAIRNSIGVMRGFSVWLETSRQKVSAPANVSIVPLDVPGSVDNLQAVADQYAIVLSWRAPAHNPDLAQGYMVRRIDGTPRSVGVITQTLYKDFSFDRGKTYTYEVSAARANGSKWIAGDGVQSVTLIAEDKTPPRTPSGLKVLVNGSGAFLTWDGNDELDLAGYRIFRNDSPVGTGPVTGNSFFDSDYRPNASYRISAVDEFGNESPKTAAVSPVR